MKKYYILIFAVLLCTLSCQKTDKNEENKISFELSSSELTIERGGTAKLTLTTTSNATGEIKWSSSNEKVATVNDGLITAITVGTTTITATAGNQKAECKVEVHITGAVDLGLSVYWAESSLKKGNTNEDAYYAWGETELKLNSDGSYQNYTEGNHIYTFSKPEDPTFYYYTKYIPEQFVGVWGGPGDKPDNKLTLDIEDDVARVKLGGKWRLPTKKEMQDLIDKCEWTWKNNGNSNGYEVTSKTTGKSIFLPAGGYLEAGIISPYTGYYWSTELGTVKSTWGSCLNFTDTEKKIGEFVRYVGCYIRPVTE